LESHHQCDVEGHAPMVLFEQASRRHAKTEETRVEAR
jgi:hypothetical protein